jgi:hypothetical protein
MLLRSTLLATVFAALCAAPAFAQDPPVPTTLDALKPCYVAAQEKQRELVEVKGHGFTAFALIDVYIDDVLVPPTPGAEPQADVDGNLTGSVPAPFIDEGERSFVLRTTEQGTGKYAIQSSKVTRLSVSQTPPSAKTSQRVTFRGRGFTDLLKPVYMHYVYGGKSKKTIQIGLPTGDCGLFKVKRKQFPFKKSPQTGVWTIQFDQERRYNAAASPRVPLTIKVKKTIKPRRVRGR